jgi:Asp-tRNA(Asn)/Glu-tRNA(Gln) amidotransferase A subunit family amidase
VEDGLRGARIGVLRQFSNTETADPEVLERFEEAIAVMRRQGATVVDSVAVEIPEGTLWCRRFKVDINAYLASLGPGAPVKNLDEIIESGRFHPPIGERLRFFRDIDTPPEENEGCREALANAAQLRTAVRDVLAAEQLDALVYPSWNNPPRLIGDLNTPHGNNSPHLSPPTGFPALTVPMGFVGDGLPVGLQLLGDAWSEGTLIRLAFSFEQATKHRRPPITVPPIR